jgi:hypothetical protein
MPLATILQHNHCLCPVFVLTDFTVYVNFNFMKSLYIHGTQKEEFYYMQENKKLSRVWGNIQPCHMVMWQSALGYPHHQVAYCHVLMTRHGVQLHKKDVSIILFLKLE